MRPRLLEVISRSGAYRGGATRIGIALQPRQVGAQISGALVTQVAVFLQRLTYNAFEFGGQIGVEPRGSRGPAAEDGLEDDG